MQRVNPIYPSFSLVMTKSGLLARDPSRLPSYRSYTHRYHPYTMAGRASRDEDPCMVRALTRRSSLSTDESQRSASIQYSNGGTGGAEHFLEEPEGVRLQPMTVRFDVADGDISEFELDSPLLESPLPINDYAQQYEQTQAQVQRDATVNASATDRLVRAFVVSPPFLPPSMHLRNLTCVLHSRG
ncbi:hypothetical protein C8Q74DRAFT_779634 [Fomes fomentarius]|nr:hypothetical protein C8Q74DRAFT_779634 [Fomes fomentarius]